MLYSSRSEEKTLPSAGNNVDVIATEPSQRLMEVWCQPPSLDADGQELFHALRASELIGSAGSSGEKASSEARRDDLADAGGWQGPLEAVIDILGAERAFVFVCSDDAPPEEVSTRRDSLEYLASSNVDGEEVLQPEDKVPFETLVQVAASGKPHGHGPERTANAKADDDGIASFHSVGLPVPWRNETAAVLFVENRFRPLLIDRTTLRISEIYCREMAGALRLEHLKRENESLWIDISRLRENGSPTISSQIPAPASKGRAALVGRSELTGDYSLIVGSSPRMIEIFHVLDRISSSAAPVLINGESGTGKELIAQAVHQNSLRKDKAFVSENCGALTETLLESELFGYVRGAFTGATKDHKGLFELAIGGTLFLDEVGDMSHGMQKKLLRVLQEGVVRRVGGKEYISVDVRILSATNKDLLEEVRSGNFREDLYYRLNVINLKLPPLRERKEDIAEIVQYFLDALSQKAGLEKTIDPIAMERLLSYNWPGNIRELQNEVRRMFALSDDTIQTQDLSETLRAGNSQDPPFQALERELASLTLKEATERLEKEMIRNALVQARGNKSQVAKVLQVPKTSLYNKINKYGIDGR